MQDQKMFVRMVGNKVCWTVLDNTERFYMGTLDECTDQERQLVVDGGGELPLSTAVDTVAR